MSFWREFLRGVASDRTLRGEDLRVFLLMLSLVEEGVNVPLTPKNISVILGTHPECVRRAIRRLVEKGVISKRYEAEKLVGYEMKKPEQIF